MVKRCIYEGCRSDSRKKSVIERGITFLPFPKPITRLDSAERWCTLIGREGFTIKDITPHSYICSLHFKPWENLDIKANPSLAPTPNQLEPSLQDYDSVRYPQLPTVPRPRNSLNYPPQPQPQPPPPKIQYKSPPPIPLPPPPKEDKVSIVSNVPAPYLRPEVLDRYGGRILLIGADKSVVSVNRMIFLCMSR